MYDLLTLPDESLAAARDQFRLGRAFGDRQPAAVARPLGAMLAVRPCRIGEVDMTAVSYDARRQIGIVREADGSVAQLAKHSTGWTSTDTASSDKQPGDSDQDATED
jgi:putative ATP-grasp target RiPP